MDESDIFWIGLKYKEIEGTFAWESGSELSPEIRDHWRSYANGTSEPNSNKENEDCVGVLVAGSKMYDSKCSRNKYEGINYRFIR